MKAIELERYQLGPLSKINILFGKNGCGKSTTLKYLVNQLRGNKYRVQYLTPERGGQLKYQSHIEHNIINSPAWLEQERNKNHSNQFREQTVVQYKNLAFEVRRKLEEHLKLCDSDQSRPSEHQKYYFSTFIQKINQLLENIELKEDGATFKFYSKLNGQEIDSADISSGESELVTIGIECLAFAEKCDSEKENLLLLDEPDVHIHPDLQARLMSFLRELVSNYNVTVIIATHSTAILGALEDYDQVAFEFMKKNQTCLIFKSVSVAYKNILPVFGAHPLSNVFNTKPIFLVEGTDDEWIWQQAIRTSEGKLKLFPCAVSGLPELLEYENKVNEIISSVYDNAKAFSLRDRDEGDEQLDDLGCVIRCKLACRAAENLMLANEVLNKMNTNWDLLVSRMNDWLSNESNSGHQAYEAMKAFKESNYDRKNFNLKKIRMILNGLMESNKAWQVAVGQAIGEIAKHQINTPAYEHSLLSYLGKKLVCNIFPTSVP